jgi:hypothetical protein
LEKTQIKIAVAKMAIGLGMEVLVYDYKMRSFDLTIELYKAFDAAVTKISFWAEGVHTCTQSPFFLKNK